MSAVANRDSASVRFTPQRFVINAFQGVQGYQQKPGKALPLLPNERAWIRFTYPICIATNGHGFGAVAERRKQIKESIEKIMLTALQNYQNLETEYGFRYQVTLSSLIIDANETNRNFNTIDFAALIQALNMPPSSPEKVEKKQESTPLLHQAPQEPPQFSINHEPPLTSPQRIEEPRGCPCVIL